jgi:hypothetical protein
MNLIPSLSRCRAWSAAPERALIPRDVEVRPPLAYTRGRPSSSWPHFRASQLHSGLLDSFGLSASLDLANPRLLTAGVAAWSAGRACRNGYTVTVTFATIGSRPVSACYTVAMPKPNWRSQGQRSSLRPQCPNRDNIGTVRFACKILIPRHVLLKTSPAYCPTRAFTTGKCPGSVNEAVGVVAGATEKQ